MDFYDSMETKLSESSDRISPLTANLLASVLAVVLLLGTRQQQHHALEVSTLVKKSANLHLLSPPSCSDWHHSHGSGGHWAGWEPGGVTHIHAGLVLCMCDSHHRRLWYVSRSLSLSHCHRILPQRHRSFASIARQVTCSLRRMVANGSACSMSCWAPLSLPRPWVMSPPFLQ